MYIISGNKKAEHPFDCSATWDNIIRILNVLVTVFVLFQIKWPRLKIHKRKSIES